MPPLNTLFRTYRNAIVSVLLILFSLIGILFAVVPSIGKMKELSGQMQELSGQNDTLRQKLEVLNALDEDALRQQLTNVLSAVPAERSFPTLFETVEGVAAQSGVAIEQMSLSGGTTLATPSAKKVSEADRKLGTRTIPFSVTVDGSLPAIEQFITVVPSVRRLLRIRTFSIAFPRDDRPVSVSMEMDAFYEPLPTSLGTVRSVLPTLSAADQEIISELTSMPLVIAEQGTLPPPLIGRVKENPFSP